MNDFSCSSQLAQFQEFLLRANKYNCLRMAGDGGAIDRKLILVEVRLHFQLNLNPMLLYFTHSAISIRFILIVKYSDCRILSQCKRL